MRRRIRNILLEATEKSIEIDGVIYDIREIYENSEGGGEDTTLSEVRKYLKKLKQLWDEGGEIYRIVFAKSFDEIDLKNAGTHWLAFSSGIDENAGYLGTQPAVAGDLNAYILVGAVPPRTIDIECSMYQFQEYPMEIEICIDQGVTVMKVYEYDWEHKWNANLIWKT